MKKFYIGIRNHLHTTDIPYFKLNLAYVTAGEITAGIVKDALDMFTLNDASIQHYIIH